MRSPIKLQNKKAQLLVTKGLATFLGLFVICLVAASCSESTGPLLDLKGSWMGGTPVQLYAGFEQSGSTVKAAGQLARAGTSDGFLVDVQGTGSISADSTILLELHGQFSGHQVLAGKLLETGVISGTISGDWIGGDGIQLIELTRYSGLAP